jgi:ribonucleoside-diphosphate reductase alpha chain
VLALSDSAWAVLRRRYLRRDGAGSAVETPEEMFRRVARAVAAADAVHGASAGEVSASEERFAARMAALEFLPNSPALMNAGRPRGQLAACFVVPVGDSMPDIFDAVKWAAEIQMTGGGTGFSFSRLRPAGDRVASTGGAASGPLAFMDGFNAATDAVRPGGTRRGANMGVLRIDHPDILEFIASKLEPARLTNFNISVALTDAFMAAVVSGGDYELVNPKSGLPVRRLDARRVFHTVASVAWRTGDPGVLFLDRINASHPIPDAGPIEATNPCVTGDTRVLVEGRGFVPIAELVGTTPRVATWGEGGAVFRTATRVVRTGHRPVLRLMTDQGHELRLTADHQVMTERGDVPAGELRRGDRLHLMGSVAPIDIDPEAEEQRDELRALFASGGRVLSSERAGLSVRLASDSPAALRRAQLELLRLGVVSSIGRGGGGALELVITGVSTHSFETRIGFPPGPERDRLRAALDASARGPWVDRAFATVRQLVPDGEAEVFDLTEPESEHFFANGLLVHNCAEQPLLPFESCVLGSVNLEKFAEAGGRDVAWGRLGEAVRDGVHFLDNVIDVNSYPLPQIEAVTRAHRKIGLGVMGFADLLIRLGVPYDSPAALEWAERIAAHVEVESLAASAALAARRGPFTRFATSRWAADGQPPLRNATTTTVAPTGTISIIAGCSSGIEPIFAVSLVRRVLDGERLVEVHPIFRAMAEERGVWSDDLGAALAERGRARGLDRVPADLAALFATAHDVSPEQHVRMQAAFQRHSHSAVSKTVNLPESATIEDVEAVYRLAYQLGCKGVTVYRDGSRSAQVLSFGAQARDVARVDDACPECGGAPLLGEGACAVCPSCGWAKCAVP